MNLSTADAQDEKGLFIKLWEKVSSRSAKPQLPPESKKVSEPVAEDKQGEFKIQPKVNSTLETKLLLSKDVIIDEIKIQIKKYPEIVGRISGLSQRESMDGYLEYYYKHSSDIPLKLEKYDNPELLALLNDIKKEVETLSVSAPAEQIRSLEPAPGKTEPVSSEEENETTLMDGMDLEAMPEDGKPEIPFTKEEMLDVIYKRLKVFAELPFMISGFFVETGQDGSVTYYYDTGEGNVALADLDKETLHKLFARINNEATALSTQRTVRQLEQQQQLTRMQQQQIQQQLQQIQQVQQQLRQTQQQAQQVMAPPVVFVPPQLPPQPQRPPQPPPQPPRQPSR